MKAALQFAFLTLLSVYTLSWGERGPKGALYLRRLTETTSLALTYMHILYLPIFILMAHED